MSKIEKHYDLVALTQLPPSALTAEDVRELQRQLRLRLDRELSAAREEAIKDLLDLTTEELAECSDADRAVVAAQWGEVTEAAEEQYFREHPEVLEVYLPRHLGE